MNAECGFCRLVLVLSGGVLALGFALDAWTVPPLPIALRVALTDGRQVTLEDPPDSFIPFELRFRLTPLASAERSSFVADSFVPDKAEKRKDAPKESVPSEQLLGSPTQRIPVEQRSVSVADPRIRETLAQAIGRMQGLPSVTPRDISTATIVYGGLTR
jgi:hypothetical protein